MSKKMAVAVLVMMIAGGALFGSGNTEAQTEDVTIKVAYPIAVDAPVSEILNGFAAQFESEHPGVTVETVYAGGYKDVKTMVQTTIDGGGDAPALAVMLATDLFDLANAQYIEPMTDYIKEQGAGYESRFIQAFMDNSYYNDETWSLPFQRSAVILYYNASLLKEAGITPPSNLDDLAAAVEALTVRDGENVTRWGIEWPSGWPYWLFQPLAMAEGQNIVGAGDAEVFFDDPAVIKAIDYYNSLSHTYGAMPKG
ncbi:MAG: ABC transporter substrate-binding protein, partial [Bacteroidetes bacterium]